MGIREILENEDEFSKENEERALRHRDRDAPEYSNNGVVRFFIGVFICIHIREVLKEFYYISLVAEKEEPD